MRLDELTAGTAAVVERVDGEGALRQHILDMGVIPGVEVCAIKLAPMGDPMEIRVQNYELTLRLAEARNITVRPLDIPCACDEETVQMPTGEKDAEKKTRRDVHHPGLGEAETFRAREAGYGLPEGTRLTFALVGNQNCGKTTLFNRLTGAHQHVGNFPGITMERMDGVIRGVPGSLITDLPGIYSMSPYSAEEVVSRNFVLREKPSAIINIVDATNIERNLYLTMQLLEMDIPVVVALNMMDEMANNGRSVDVNRMEALLGAPVVPISAVRNEGVDELIRHAVHIAKYKETPLSQDYCDISDNGGAVHRCLHAVGHLIEGRARKAGIAVRFAATKAVEGDRLIIEQLQLSDNERHVLDHIVGQMEAERGLDRVAAIADMRFSFVKKVCDACVTRVIRSRERERSLKIDSILTGRYTAIPVFIGIMGLVFYLTFHVIGAWMQGLLEMFITYLAHLTDAALVKAGVSQVFHSLIIDGVFEGVGSVLSFLPIIVTMFFFLSLMEDSGYIARVAFVMDKVLRKVGLSGRSIVSLLIGFGCTVPAVMSTRTLPSERDRRMTILLTPFMSCTAKLPIYAFFTSVFFPAYGGLVMTGLYVTGIVFGILIALIFKITLFKGEAVPFVMELPNYRMPSARNVWQLLWYKVRDFLQRAFTVILVATIIVWFLQSFDIRFGLVDNSDDSILAMLSGRIAPLFTPIGLGDWRIVTSLISGFMAKESVVSVMEVLFAASGAVASSVSALSAMCLMVFVLLYTPCVAAVAAIRREMGVRWALGVICWQCIVAYCAALIVHVTGALLGFG